MSTFTSPNWNLEGDIYGSGDQDGCGLERSGGEIQLQAVGFKSDLDLFVTNVYGRELHGASTDGPRNEKLRFTLPAGRYVVFVRASEDSAG